MAENGECFRSRPTFHRASPTPAAKRPRGNRSSARRLLPHVRRAIRFLFDDLRTEAFIDPALDQGSAIVVLVDGAGQLDKTRTEIVLAPWVTRPVSSPSQFLPQTKPSLPFL
jgi:hypothetical protein